MRPVTYHNFTLFEATSRNFMAQRNLLRQGDGFAIHRDNGSRHKMSASNQAVVFRAQEQQATVYFKAMWKEFEEFMFLNDLFGLVLCRQ